MPVLFLFLAVFFWSGHNVVAKGIIDFVPPFSFTFVRWLLAFLILLPFAWSFLVQDWMLARKSWKRLLLIAATGICAFNSLMYVALQSTSAVNVGLISSLFPVTIALFSLLLLKVSLGRPQVVGMVVCFVGVIVVIFRGDISTFAGLDFVAGDIWMLLAVFCGSLYPVLLHEKPDIHPLSLLVILVLFGTLLSVPLFLIDFVLGKRIQLNQQVVLGMGYVAIFPSVLSYMCWNRGIELVGANHAGLFLNLIPVLTAILAYLFIGETISWYHFLGLIMVIGGMWLFNLKHSGPGPESIKLQD